MTRSHVIALLALMTAAPMAGLGVYALLPGGDTPCFSAGDTGYRLTDKVDADYVVRIDSAAAQPDLTLQVVDDPSVADFVLADGVENLTACSGTHTIRTIRVDAQARAPDLTVALVRGDRAGHYKLYAHADDFTVQDAAALFAVMVQSGHRSAALRNLSARGDITGSLTSYSPRDARQ